ITMSTKNENYNADELEPPAWMNEEFFVEVLTQSEKESDVKVIDTKISPATEKGDHASVMFRASVEYSTPKGKLSKSLIIKTMPEEEGFKKDFLGDVQFFPTEIAMYTEILPKFQAILREAGDETQLCANCIYHSLTPRQVMVFEDLVPMGYEVIRKRPITLEEINTALGKLAKWHAVSFKLIKEQPELFDRFKYDLTTVPNYLEQDFQKTSLPDFIEALGSVESLKKFQKYFERIQKEGLVQRWVDIIREYRCNRQKDAYYVLCHGDFHSRNMMFKGTECLLLDFQISYVGSMTNDVLYALYMFVGPEERLNKYDEIIYEYFETFRKTLLTIGYKGEMPNL
ncbi:hypothetical protein KR222_000973, partial [Zaprionus bogoriensis]